MVCCINTVHGTCINELAMLEISVEELIESGKDFPPMGLGFQPPSVSDILNTQHSAEFTDWQEEVKHTKTV